MTQSSVTRIKAARPAEGEVRVQVATVALSALGTQLAGTVDAVARDSIGFARGDRVAFRSDAPRSGRVIVPERDLMGVPADVSLDAAAGLFPCALLARTVTRQVTTVGSGDRVAIRDSSALAPFVRAWVEHLGAAVVDPGGKDGDADVVITNEHVRAARAVRPAHGTAQQAAADVFGAIRAGAFDSIPFSTPDEARKGSRSPVVLHPTEVTLAA